MFYVSSHLGEHVQERVSVGVDDRGDVRDAIVHVGPHHLHLLVKVGLGVGRLDLLVHPLPHELGLGLDKLLVEDVGSGDEVSWLQNGDRHPEWLHLVAEAVQDALQRVLSADIRGPDREKYRTEFRNEKEGLKERYMQMYRNLSKRNRELSLERRVI